MVSVSKVIHFEKTSIELVQTELCYIATIYIVEDKKIPLNTLSPWFHFKFNSDGDILEDFIKELHINKSSNLICEFMSKNMDVVRAFKL